VYNLSDTYQIFAPSNVWTSECRQLQQQMRFILTKHCLAPTQRTIQAAFLGNIDAGRQAWVTRARRRPRWRPTRRSGVVWRNGKLALLPGMWRLGPT